jgi:hypothetical protein
MNRQDQPQKPESREPVARIVDEAEDPSLHPVTRRNLKKTQKKLAVMRLVMIGLISAILIVGILLAVLPLFHVSEIVVEGNKTRSAEEIIAASGITVGDEIFAVISARGKGELQNKIFAACPNLKTVKISCGFSKVTITVTEMETVMYTSSGSDWYAFNTDLLVLERNADPSAFSPFLRVKLPTVARATVGGELVFAKSEIDYGYITGFLDLLEEYEVLENVTYIDFSSKLSLSCVFADRLCLELGDMKNTDKKFERLTDILRELTARGGEECYVIDVTDPGKATYRTVNRENLYD